LSAGRNDRLRGRLRYLTVSGRPRRYLLAGLIGVLAFGALWIAITAILTLGKAEKLRSRLDEIRVLVAQGHLAEARAAATDVPALASDAHWLTTGPAWWVAANVPYLGRPFEIARAMTTAGGRIGEDGVPLLMDAATRLDPAQLRSSADTVKLAPLVAAAPQLSRGAAILDDAVSRLQAAPQDGWLGPLNSQRSRLEQELASISGYVDAAARASRALPTMLGQYKPQRYFIALQNEAEFRGTGGLPGAFAIAVVSHGKLHFTHFESDAALLPNESGHAILTGLDFGAGYEQAYGPSAPTLTFVDSNVSPNFPYAAQIWAKMWELRGGEHVDGAMAVDPTVLSYLLRATHATTSYNGVTVTADNVVPLTERDEYAMFSDDFARKQFFVSVLKQTATQVISGSGNAIDIVQAMSRGSKEGRILVWSADRGIEAQLAQTGYAGAIPTDSRPVSAVILNDAQGGKLDYYLKRSLTYQSSGCSGSRDVTATYTLESDAPAQGLPAIVTERLDHPTYPTKPGDTKLILDYYASKGAKLESVTINGAHAAAGVFEDLGHPIFRLNLELKRGARETITFHVSEPVGSGSPLIWQQPGVNPIQILSVGQGC
jgi:hypothetical protein